MNEVSMERIRGLAVFTRQMSAMIDAGINLANCLTAMGADAAPPYDQYARDVVQSWNNGDTRTLSATIRSCFRSFM